MTRTWQFQNLAFQQQIPDEPTVPLQAVSSQTTDFPLALPETPFPTMSGAFEPDQAAGVTDALTLEQQATTPSADQTMPRQKKWTRTVALTLGLLLLLALFLVWHGSTSSASSPTITSSTDNSLTSLPDAGTTPASSDATPSPSATIQVYVLGAVSKPGVYLLPADARIYQLLQAAGGPLPDANLVALNLAAPLADGEEVYVLATGETPPDNLNVGNPAPTASSTATAPAGQLLNINTATAAQMEQTLHVSSTTAAKIIAYRTQHGPYTAVDQLLQAISEEIYKRIENLVTV